MGINKRPQAGRPDKLQSDTTTSPFFQGNKTDNNCTLKNESKWQDTCSHCMLFNLSGNLILLLDLRSSSTGGVLAVPIGEADSGGPGTGTTYRGTAGIVLSAIGCT